MLGAAFGTYLLALIQAKLLFSASTLNLINPILVASYYVFTFNKPDSSDQDGRNTFIKNQQVSFSMPYKVIRDNTTYREPKENLIVNRESEILFKTDAPRA